MPRSISLAPIRLVFYQSSFDLGSPTLNSNFNNVLIPLVNNFFTQALSVYSVQGNLKISQNLCTSTISIPTSHQTLGLPNADLIIYLITDNTSGQAYTALGDACVLDNNLNNPIAGYIQINAQNFNSYTQDVQYSIILHEMTHLLGFSQSLSAFWKNNNGVSYAPNESFLNTTIRGVSTNLVITPHVMEKTREAFGCNSVTGMELDNPGPTGGYHWKMRIMFNDIMVPSPVNNFIYSSITLALLQDTGWYNVNYNIGQVPLFGNNAGCGYFSNRCITNGISNFPNLFCTSAGAATCDPFNIYKANCNIIISFFLPVPSAYQYFLSPYTGGADPSPDYCPYNAPIAGSNCRSNSITSVSINSSTVLTLPSTSIY